MKVFKLGQGPINFDWNTRYVKLNNTTLEYSDTPSMDSPKQLELSVSLVSCVCSLKGKANVVALIEPPPVNKSFFFAFESYEAAVEFREHCLRVSAIVDFREVELVSIPKKHSTEKIKSAQKKNVLVLF